MVTGHLPVPAGSASSSPLEALEACLRGMPLSGSLPPQPPASFWSRSPQPGDPGSQRPELPRRGPHSKGSLCRGLGVAFVLMHGTGSVGGSAEDAIRYPLLIPGQRWGAHGPVSQPHLMPAPQQPLRLVEAS